MAGDRKGKEEEEETTTTLLSKLPINASEEEQQEGQHEARRTGTVWTAIAHIITAVIGAGVLSLAWSIAQLGWVAGPTALLFFSVVTLIESTLLIDCYRTPDPEHGHIRNRHYMDAVKHFLGERRFWICGFIQQLGLFGSGLAYTITSATSMRAIRKSNCYHKHGHSAPCSFSDTSYMLLFGVIQLVFSQIPGFHEMAWLSAFAAVMSFTYSSIGFFLGLAKVIGNGRIKGSIGGIPMATATQKIWRISQALGDIAYAYPYSVILFDIEDTLKSPPPENQTMKKAANISMVITTFFYVCCGCFGYAAFGDDTPGNLLTGFGFYEPFWLIDLANACVALHLVGGYQVFSQPVFSFAEKFAAARFPDNPFVNKFYAIQLVPFLKPYRINLFRVSFRTLFVATTTWLAIFFPYFNEVLGLLGSSFFWPMAIYFPVEMYLVQKSIRPWTKRWISLQAFSIVCLLVSIYAFIGSFEGLINERLR